MLVHRIGQLAVVLGGVVLAGACSSTESAHAGLAKGCTLNSDCDSGLVCSFGLCHVECKTSADCTGGAACVQSSNGVDVCQLSTESTCTFTHQCPDPLVCAVDSKCRNQCVTDRDCLANQKCAARGVCAEVSEVTPTGQLKDSPDAGGTGTGGASGAGGTGAGGTAGAANGGEGPDASVGGNPSAGGSSAGGAADASAGGTSAGGTSAGGTSAGGTSAGGSPASGGAPDASSGSLCTGGAPGSPTPPACVDTGNGVAIAGSILYGGTRTGRLYVMATDNNRSIFAGTSLSTGGGSPYAYVIRGLPLTNGPVKVVAYLDTGNDTIANVPSDPIATTQITMSGSTQAGVNLNLADPTPAAVPTLAAPQVVALSGGAYLQVRAPQDANGLALLDAIRIYWDTSPNPSASQHLGTLTTTASGFPTVGGLTNGTTYYFSAAGVAAGVEGAPSPSVSAVPAPSASSGHDVSGTISYSCDGVAKASVATVALIGLGVNAGTIAATSLTANPQPYTIHGVPDGIWSAFGFIVMNGNGLMDLGDETSGLDVGSPFVAVSGAAATAPPVVIRDTSGLASVKTSYSAGAGYSLKFNVEPNRKTPVYASVCGGPHISTPSDFGLNNSTNAGRWSLNWNIASVPSTVESYAVNATYSDGTTETLAVPVTRVFTDAPYLASPSGAGASSAPTLTWTIPLSAPASGYAQEISVATNSGSQLWNYAVPAGVTSVVYNVDGRASQATLASGQSYQWSVDVVDQFGNSAYAQTTFTTQ
jgi:hypothetical protein